MLDIDTQTEERELYELHREMGEMGSDPDWVSWLLEVERNLDRDLGESRDQ